MPTYEYACKSCGEHLEVVQSFTDDALTVCPACGGALRKVFGNIGIAFKGSGFYKNDSRSATSSSSPAASSSGTSGEGGGSSGGSPSGEGSPSGSPGGAASPGSSSSGGSSGGSGPAAPSPGGSTPSAAAAS